jgi:cytochrome c-type biogenesis protein CcmE
MTPRRRRMMLVGLILLAVSSAVALALTAFKDNVLYFYDPSAVASGKAPVQRVFRLGGMVEQGSVKREPGSLEMQFVVTDFAHDMTVRYSGVLPDLFREGQGVIARGKLVTVNGRQEFVAEEVLAKHDEKYMPPEVADSLKKSHDQRLKAGTMTTPMAAAVQ